MAILANAGHQHHRLDPDDAAGGSHRALGLQSGPLQTQTQLLDRSPPPLIRRPGRLKEEDPPMTPKNPLGMKLRRSKTLRVLVATTLATSMMAARPTPGDGLDTGWPGRSPMLGSLRLRKRPSPASLSFSRPWGGVVCPPGPTRSAATAATWPLALHQYPGSLEPRYRREIRPQGRVRDHQDRRLPARSSAEYEPPLRLERAEALKFLVHFVEDMHQPVHVGHRGDRGGNDLQVQFFFGGRTCKRRSGTRA